MPLFIKANGTTESAVIAAWGLFHCFHIYCSIFRDKNLSIFFITDVAFHVCIHSDTVDRQF